jgi:UDP-glucose 4-epimerase
MRILVTGGLGFIGSNVVDAYVALGHEVLIVDNLITGQRQNHNVKAKCLELDICSAEAAQAISDFRPEIINHHAAQIDVRKSVAEPRFDADCNVVGALNVLEAGRRGGALSRVIYAASGGSMYGDTVVLPTPERHAIQAISPYGVSKAALELYLQCFHALYGLHYVALRYANVYGPRQNVHGEAGVVAIFAKRILADKPCVIYGDGKQTRDFVCVFDVVQANVRALSTPFVGGVNIGTGVEVDVNTIFSLLAKHAGKKTVPTYEAERLGEQRRCVLDNSLAKTALGWSPEFRIEAGIEKTMAWYRGHR